MSLPLIIRLIVQQVHVESGGERQDQHTNEAASRARAAAAASHAAPEVVIIEGIAITARVSRAATAVASRQRHGSVTAASQIPSRVNTKHFLDTFIPSVCRYGPPAVVSA